MFASIYIPHFHVQALVRSEPELLGKPLAVVDGTPPLLKVIEVNPAAGAAGVETGMAKLKVEHFFDVAIRRRSEAQELSAHAALLDCAGAFSPRVENTATDTVVVDLDGLDRLFGSHHEIAARIYDQTILVGLQPNIAVAANPDAAIHASRGFAGLLVIPSGTERRRLSELPLRILSADAEFGETLHRWGIRTFGAFAALPLTKISERLGQNGVRLHKLARGASARPLNPHQESFRFDEVMELDHAIATLEPLTFVMSRLLDQICRRLRMRNRATHEVRVTLDLDERGAQPHERVLRLPIAVHDAGLLVKLLMLDLESHPPKAAVVKVRIEAIPTRPRTVQNGLFTPLAPEPEKLELTLARVTHIVGSENVGSPELLDTHRPDAFRVHRPEWHRETRRFSRVSGDILQAPGFSPGESNHISVESRSDDRCVVPMALVHEDTDEPLAEAGGWGNVTANAAESCAATLCFRQFRPALDASVQLHDGKPVWIAFHGTFGPITTASGPWNSSGEWWREERWSREEWDVGIESRSKGFGMYRIYRDTATGRWFAEGVYD